MIRALALLLTLATGFSGLAYQVAWQKYLATLLGSHGEATAAVLGIFLGGLALGYWLFGRVTARLVQRSDGSRSPPRLLFVYGVIEVSIGVYAMAFPTLFEGARFVSFVLPHLPAGLGFAIDVVLAAALIGPPTILMGGTIPILTQALAHNLDDATRFHALVYAFNTVGAFGGALAAGFYLVPVLGLVRVMFAMGVVNLSAGAFFILLGQRRRVATAVGGQPAGQIEGFATYAIIAILIGFAMMVIQTTVIRVSGLAFGSSHFTFSIVVAIFVLCIAIGSFAVSAASSIRSRHVVANQWSLAVLASILYFALLRFPYWAHVTRSFFRDHSGAFYAYQLDAFLLVLMMIGPAVVCSGATLPLLFHQLRREVGELGSVAGTLYSWNTVGSLVGALLGGYALLFWLDLHHVYRIALIALVVAAGMLTIRVYRLPRAGSLGVLALAMVPLTLSPWDPWILSIGLFRTRAPTDETYSGFHRFFELFEAGSAERLVYYEDDPTTSVSVSSFADNSLTLRVNGKSDGNTVGDRLTTTLLGLIPAMFADDPKRAFVIGLGTGITVSELASLESVEEVLVAEISSGVIGSAALFPNGAASNRNVHIERSDAYRALMRTNGVFDVIVSEPSNPWVAGVEMVYSREFLETAQTHLSPGGVFAQWFHSYETDREALELVLRTFTSVFDHVAVWMLQAGDLLLLGFENPTSATDHFRLEQRSQMPDVAAALRRAGVRNFAALLAHEIVPVGVLHTVDLPGPVHSLYHPRLSDQAARAFFVGDRATLPFTGSRESASIGASNSLLRRYAARFGGRLPDDQRAAVLRETCEHLTYLCATQLAAWQRDDPESARLARLKRRADPKILETAEAVKELFDRGYDADEEPVSLRDARAATARYIAQYHHAEPFAGESLLDVWGRCRVEPPSPEECAKRRRAAREAAPLADEAELDEWRERCQSQRKIGHACQRGLDEARTLLIDGDTASNAD